MTTVHRRNEIHLFGDFFPIMGDVKIKNAAQLAEKQVFGDFSKESDQVLSSWIIADQRGGIGVLEIDEKIHGDRVWFSTSHISTNGHMTLPNLITDATNPGGADLQIVIEYQNTLYAVFGDKLYRRIEGSNTWSASLGTLVEAPTDAIVHKSKIYFACGTDFNRYDGTNLVTGASLNAAQPSRFFVEWVDRLYNLDNDGQMDYSSNEGVGWTADALSSKPSGSFTSLFKYHDGASPKKVVIYLGTKEGLLEHDNGNTTWIDTGLPLPFHEHACKGSVWWRESAWIPSGMLIYKFDIGSDGPTIMPIGLDRDDGVPPAYSGHITKLLAGHNYLYALIDATDEGTRDLYGGDGDTGTGNAILIPATGFSWVARYDGHGWSIVHVGTSSETPILAGTLATANDAYRIWFGVDNTIKYADLSVSLENPTAVSTSKFAASSENITGWFDNNESTATKLGIELNGLFSSMTDDEYIMIYYGLDYDEDTWTLLTNTDFPLGKITTSGQADFVFGNYDEGIAFKSIRFKEELIRGSTNTLAPDRRWLRLGFLPVLPVRWGFTVRVDCRRNYRFRNKKAMTLALKAALETQTMGAFQYRDGNGAESHRVKIIDMPGAEIGGKEHEGIFDVTLLAL